MFYTSIYPYFGSYLQVVQYQNVTSSGYITSTFSITSAIASIVVGLLIKYTKHYKYYMCAGTIVYLLATALLIRYRVEGSTIGQIVGTQICLGIGGGFFNVPVQLGVQAAVPHQDVAAATALLLTIIEIGGAVGAAISGAVWTGNIAPKLAAYLPDDTKSQAFAIAGNFTLAQTFEGEARAAINRSYQETMNILLTIAVCLAILPVILSFFMKNYKIDAVSL